MKWVSMGIFRLHTVGPKSGKPFMWEDTLVSARANGKEILTWFRVEFFLLSGHHFAEMHGFMDSYE